MLAIKLSRIGKKHQPSFRLLVLEKSKDPWGNFLEDLGYYNPLTKKSSLNNERINYWISKGAQPTKTVHNLLVNLQVIAGKKVKVTKVTMKNQEAKKQSDAKEGEKAEK
ncbi:MAG: 30S ribosomal protein S16 [Patescibacteria group bacterium]|jgi:small subunit ribosomal protein S16